MIDRTRTLELAQPLMDRHAPTGWRVVNARSNCRNYLGVAYQRSKLITIAGHLHATEDELVRTVLHEIAHALDDADARRMTYYQKQAAGLLERSNHDARFLEFYYRLLELEGMPLPGEGMRKFD